MMSWAWVCVFLGAKRFPTEQKQFGDFYSRKGCSGSSPPFCCTAPKAHSLAPFLPPEPALGSAQASYWACEEGLCAGGMLQHSSPSPHHRGEGTRQLCPQE